MPEITNQRVVAIVGRPNVGKSALFNRLAGRRLAIVHEESGVTRDRISCMAVWGDKKFELIDTGGVGLMDDAAAADEIVQGTRKQVDIAIEDAAVIIMVTDLTAGVMPLDQDVARLLHASGKKVVVAANKADHEGLASQSVEFERLGFPAYPISALHNRGIDDLMSPVLRDLPGGPADTEEHVLNIAVVGRPNVGKSSYINRLLGRERVIVSERPGTTRDSIEIPFELGKGAGLRRYLLIDTAGMRKVGKVHKSVERFSVFRAEKSIERADIVVLMLDAVQGPTVQDKKIAATILDQGKGCILVVNKWDLAGDTSRKVYEEALRRVMFFLNFAPVVFLSAKSGFNMRTSVEVINHVAEQIGMQLTTGLLNRVMRDAFDRVQPPRIQGRRMKLFYATQTGTCPPRIRLFVNDPMRLTDAYRLYLAGTLRKVFGLEGAPIFFDLKARQQKKP